MNIRGEVIGINTWISSTNGGSIGLGFTIPINKKVEDIMAKKPLRERVAGLLLPDQQLAIGFHHNQLLKRMKLIDRTIDFLDKHRGMKVFFF